jgi:hypothetical protein
MVVDASFAYDLATLVGLVGLAGCAFFSVLFAHELTVRLMAPMAGRRSPEPGTTPAAPGQRRTVSWLWASPLPVATAILVAIATTPLTAPITAWLTGGELWFGVIPAACALGGAAWSTLALVRRSRNGAPAAGRTLRTEVPAVVIWLVAVAVMVPAVLPMLIDSGGRSITDMTVITLLLVPCPAWVLLRRSNRRHASTETAPA